MVCVSNIISVGKQNKVVELPMQYIKYRNRPSSVDGTVDYVGRDLVLSHCDRRALSNFFDVWEHAGMFVFLGYSLYLYLRHVISHVEKYIAYCSSGYCLTNL